MLAGCATRGPTAARRGEPGRRRSRLTPLRTPAPSPRRLRRRSLASCGGELLGGAAGLGTRTRSPPRPRAAGACEVWRNVLLLYSRGHSAPPGPSPTGCRSAIASPRLPARLPPPRLHDATAAPAAPRPPPPWPTKTRSARRLRRPCCGKSRSPTAATSTGSSPATTSRRCAAAASRAPSSQCRYTPCARRAGETSSSAASVPTEGQAHRRARRGRRPVPYHAAHPPPSNRGDAIAGRDLELVWCERSRRRLLLEIQAPAASTPRRHRDARRLRRPERLPYSAIGRELISATR